MLLRRMKEDVEELPQKEEVRRLPACLPVRSVQVHSFPTSASSCKGTSPTPARTYPARSRPSSIPAVRRRDQSPWLVPCPSPSLTTPPASTTSNTHSALMVCNRWSSGWS